MKDLAIAFRSAQLSAHAMHNYVKGCNFLANHDYLGGLYGKYEDAYDAVIERMIGLGDMPDISAITKASTSKCCQYDLANMEATDMFKLLLEIESNIRQLCASYSQGASLGSQNLLAQFADDSEARTYKLKQLTKDDEEAEDPIAKLMSFGR